MYSLQGDTNTGKALARQLKRYLPESLPLVACLTSAPPPTAFTVNSSANPEQLLPGNSDQERDATGSPLLLGCCFPAQDDQNPPLIRFFCSAEVQAQSSSLGPQGVVDDQVRAFFLQWIPQLAQDLNHPNHILIGSLHYRWVSVLLKSGLDVRYNGPCIKVLCSPSATILPTVGSENYEIASLAEESLERVLETSTVPRSKEYLLGRLRYSLCVKKEGKLAGWGLIHSDGSIGTLFVEPEFRRMGFGKILLDGLVELARGLQPSRPVKWVQTDVVKSNEGALRLFSNLDAWQIAWETSWMALAVPRPREEAVEASR